MMRCRYPFIHSIWAWQALCLPAATGLVIRTWFFDGNNAPILARAVSQWQNGVKCSVVAPTEMVQYLSAESGGLEGSRNWRIM
jgi:hypothetical protein